jgi:glycosyl transferase family 87
LNQSCERVMRLRKILLAALLFLSIILIFKYVILFPYGSVGIDFDKHYIAAKRVLAGESPFDGELYLSFNYPQFVAWINLPLAFFSDVGKAKLAWDICNILLLLATALIAIFGFRPSFNPAEKLDASGNVPLGYFLLNQWWIAALFLTFFFTPNIYGLRPANLSLYVLFTITLLGWAVVKDARYMIGLMIAICSLVKVMPVLLIFPFIIARDKKVLTGAALCWSIYFFILLFSGTLRHEWYFVTQVIPHVGARWKEVSYSLTYVLCRRFFPSIYSSSVMSIINAFWDIILFGSFLAVTWKRRDLVKTTKGNILIFIMGTLMLPLLSPLLEYLHFVWIFPGLLATFYLAWNGFPGKRNPVILIVFFFLLSVVGTMSEVVNFGVFPVMPLVPFIGFILYITSIITVLRGVAPHETPPR